MKKEKAPELLVDLPSFTHVEKGKDQFLTSSYSLFLAVSGSLLPQPLRSHGLSKSRIPF